MSCPFINLNLEPSLEVLSQCVQQTNDNYQRLLTQPESLELCAEAGKSLRLLSRRFSQVLIAVINSESEPEDSDWENEEGKLVEEELDD